MEEKVAELTNQLVEEEEKTKQITKQKNKYEAIIADLEERLKREQEVMMWPPLLQMCSVVNIFERENKNNMCCMSLML